MNPTLLTTVPALILLLPLAAAVVLICIGLVLGGRTAFVLFPAQDTNLLRARVQFPDGSPIGVSQAAVLRLEKAAAALNDDPELTPAAQGDLVRQIYSAVGEWSEFLPRKGSALCETSIELMPAKVRRVDVSRIIERWRREIGKNRRGRPFGGVTTSLMNA